MGAREAQRGPHNDATIIGNRQVLENIKAAIAEFDDAEARVFARDGEGHRIHIQMITIIDNLRWPRYADPYSPSQRNASPRRQFRSRRTNLGRTIRDRSGHQRLCVRLRHSTTGERPSEGK